MHEAVDVLVEQALDAAARLFFRSRFVDVLVAARCTPNPWTYEDYPGLRRSGTKTNWKRKLSAASERSHVEVQKK